MISHPGTATKMFEALYDADINIHMISTSETKISVLIDTDLSDKAVQAVHDAFIAISKHIEKISDSKGDKTFSGDTAKENVKIMLCQGKCIVIQ